MKKIVFLCWCLGCGVWSVPLQLRAQPLTIEKAIERTLKTYPSVQQSEEAIRSSQYNIRLAQAAFLPVITGQASYTRLEPRIAFDFEGRSYPFESNNSYNAHIQVSQLIYDFGKSMPAVHQAQIKEEIAGYQKDELLQQLALNTIKLYYMISFARQAIVIKQQEIMNHEELLRQVTVQVNSGAATEYDLLSTQVSESNIRSQLTSLNTNHQTLQVQFSQLLDTLIDEKVMINSILYFDSVVPALSALLEQAYVNRSEMIIAQHNILLADWDVKNATRAYNPSLNLSAQAGGKNDYPNNIEQMQFFWNAGVALSVPIFNGNRNKQSIRLAKSARQSAIFQQAIIKKEVTNDVSDLYYQYKADLDKMSQFKSQVDLAQKAYNQAKVNYGAGSITNLELLTSSTNLSNSKLMLLQSQINCVIDKYQLQVSIGQVIWK